jgi:HlyD family secretion protein
MNTNSIANQPVDSGANSANQGGVKPSTFLGTALLSVALLGVAAGWLGHKPAVLVQGEVEASKIKVVPQFAGTIKAWQVRQGDKGRKRQRLVSVETVQTALGQDCAAGSTKEPSQILRGSLVEDICLQSNWWMKAKAVAEHAQETMNRSRELQSAGVVSLQELEATERALDVARSSERAAKANLDLAVTLCGQVERLSAAAEHAALRIAELEGLVTELSLSSPIDGEMQRQIAGQGECVTPGSPVASVADLQDLWVRFNVPENSLANIRIGTTFCVQVPSLGNQEVPVKVNYIAPDRGFASSRHPQKTADFAGKTFEVRAVPIQVTAGLRPGMSVLADWGKF